MSTTRDRQQEVREAVDRYTDLRVRIDDGQAAWPDLADLFTDDAVYIDPAWGRVEGVGAIRTFIEESMQGLDDWTFPVEFTAIEGDDVVIKWTQRTPGQRADGSPFEQSGYSRLIYGGGGKFRYEEDLLNMTHVLEDLGAAGWRPGNGFNMPPAEPIRDFSH
jgi:hypothetical protein